MSATIYGDFTAPIPQPVFRARRDETGKWTASLTVSIKRGDYETHAPSFERGTLIDVIYPQVQTYFAGFVVTDHEYIEKPGAIDEVVINFNGFVEEEIPSERDKVYDYQVDLAERPIIEHPKFLAYPGLYPPNQQLLVWYYEGKIRPINVEEGIFLDNFNGNPQRKYEFAEGLYGQEFYDIIVKKGIRTYLDPTAEYTETITDLGGLDGEIDDMGKIDTPPGSPPGITGKIWFMSGASQTVSSDNPITYSRKWTTIFDNDENNFLYGP
jgi:hypothetical protein